jgi:hypothetical protein
MGLHNLSGSDENKFIKAPYSMHKPSLAKALLQVDLR